jgi:nucleoside-diphosphate-sugar epimerase
MSTALVLGASGFLGSHVVKQLVAAGQAVRIFTRSSSNTRTIDHLDVERFTGNIHDEGSLLAAMQGCDIVYHCIVDTRSWLRDSTPLFRTNVDGTRHILDAALKCNIKRLVFTSSIVTIGLSDSGIANEDTVFNWWNDCPDYVKTRVLAEQLVQEYVGKGLDAVICNVATTYGEADAQPTPHGQLAQFIALGKMPVYWGSKMNLVGIKDAARGLILAAEKGKKGERYLITDQFMTMKEFCQQIAAAANKRGPQIYLPMWFMYIACAINQTIMHAFGKDTEVTIASLKLSKRMGDFDNSKARKELGWEPQPLTRSFEEAARWFQQNSTAN